MGEQSGLLDLREEIRYLGQNVYQAKRMCPSCQAYLQELEQHLDYLDGKNQSFLVLEEENIYLRNKISRHLDFGEPLNYC